ncbi:MAG: hypothetical protein A2073_05725 [Deltaproteobacteria bacterium GWC2_42_11]|nr:MAG: hypothetical protein A2073_05725 [Deltaproteobacteria bacterium GWC2_42_11]
MEKPDISENIIESLAQGVIAVDNLMNITVFNQAAEKITGISSSYAVKRHFTDVFTRDRWLHDIMNATIKKCNVFTEYEGSIVQRYGTPRSVSVTTAPVFNTKGDMIGAVVILKDTSHIKPLEQESARRDRLAFIGTFAASLAHEVKNPLGGIRGAAQLLSKRLKEKTFREYTDLIIRESDRLNSIMEDILEFANPKKINPLPVNIHKILDDVLMLQQCTIDARGINNIIREYDPSIPPILGDSEQLMQVFLNIIKNSIEAVGKNGEVRIITRVAADFHLIEERYRGGKFAEIEVRDNGCGIPEEYIEKIFTPFFTTKKKGSGLGLAISLKIIKEHGGFFRIDSTQGKGTVVSVLLPITREG